MSGLYGTYKTDKQKEDEGFELQLLEAPNEDNTIPTFTLSRMTRSNSDYMKAMEKASRPYRKKQQLGHMTSAESDEVMLEVFLDVTLKGWKNVQDDKNQNIPFNAANARKLMQDLPDLYERLLTEASEMTNFRAATQEQETKN